MSGGGINFLPLYSDVISLNGANSYSGLTLTNNGTLVLGNFDGEDRRKNKDDDDNVIEMPMAAMEAKGDMRVLGDSSFREGKKPEPLYELGDELLSDQKSHGLPSLDLVDRYKNRFAVDDSLSLDQFDFAENKPLDMFQMSYDPSALRLGFGGGRRRLGARNRRLASAYDGGLVMVPPMGVSVDYSWFNNLFAPLPPPPATPQEPKQPWPAEARKSPAACCGPIT